MTNNFVFDGERPSELSLGWQVDAEWQPTYWSSERAEIGLHSDSDLVQVPASLMARHGIVIAQSGSGKSYLIGRLVEELLLKTKARVAVIDPNADFRFVHKLKESEPEDSEDHFPTESLRDYRERWSSVDKAIFLMRAEQENPNSHNFELWWPNVSVDVFTQELNPRERTEVAHCHRFVQLLTKITDLTGTETGGERIFDSFLDSAERLFFDVKEGQRSEDENWLRSLTDDFRALVRIPSQRRNEADIQRVIAPLTYASLEVGRYYFSRARYFQQSGILSNRPHSDDFVSRRLTVLDLPSFSDLDTRYLAVSSTLNLIWRVAIEEWEAALASASEDRRVPTFIVLDEAHNLVPREPRSAAASAVREQFRTIAAEGRKYGVFIVAATQRPDKLDPLILSEFENKAVMRISSPQVLESIKTQLGISGREATALEEATSLAMGRGILFGRWTDYEPTRFATAARRTVEGGRSLNPHYWSTQS